MPKAEGSLRLFMAHSPGVPAGSIRTARFACDFAMQAMTSRPLGGRAATPSWREAAAADQLRLQLEKQASQRPGLRQFIVAHSHGGNVALLASSRVSGSPPIVVALATPFVFARKRDLGISFLTAAAVGIGIVILSTLVLAFIGANPANVRLQWWQAALGGLAAFELVLIWVGMHMHGQPTRAEVREKMIASSHVPETTADSLLVIRAPGDEASGLLISGQFFSWVSSRLAQVAFSNVMPFLMVIGMLMVFTGIGVVSMGGNEHLANSLAIVGIFAYFIPLLFAFALISALILPSLVFGIDGPYASLIAATTAESTPPGMCTLVQLDRTLRIGMKGLSHSSLYDDDAAIDTIVNWANGFMSVPAT